MANDKIIEKFKTGREVVEELWTQEGKSFSVQTDPLYSTITFVFEVRDHIRNGSNIVTQSHAVLVPQKVAAFGYGSDVKVVDGGIPDIKLPVTTTMTNLTNARCTPGDIDFVMEGLSASVMGMRCRWTDAAINAAPPNSLTREMLRGARHLSDPACLASPAQQSSPMNLCDPLFHLLRPAVAVSFNWNAQRLEPKGRLDMVGGALTSYLHAEAEPSKDSRLVIPEGQIWLHKGSQLGHDSELAVICEVFAGSERVVPITLPDNLLGVARSSEQYITHLFVDVTITSHGLSYYRYSEN